MPHDNSTPIEFHKSPFGNLVAKVLIFFDPCKTEVS